LEHLIFTVSSRNFGIQVQYPN